MHLLRTLTLLPRMALVWFVLSIGIAVASPFVHPQNIEMVCGGAKAVKLIVHGDGGTQELDASAMDCPLCMPTGAPPPSPVLPRVAMALPLAHAVQSIPAARIAAATAAPLPARGPPVLD